MKTRSRPGFILSLCGLALSFLLLGCSASTASKPTPTPIPTPIVASKPTYAVQRGTVIDEIVFNGRFAAAQEEKLYFRMDGRIGKVMVRLGDKVKKGDVLAELEISDLLNQLAQAQLTLQQAQIKLKSAQDNVAEQQTQLDIALETARLRLEQTKVRAPAPGTIIAAANRDKAAAAVQAAQAAYDRRGQVSGSAEAIALQRATWDYDIAVAQYDLAVQSAQAWEYDVRVLEQSVLLAQSNIRKAALSVDPVLAQDVAKAQLGVERLNNQVANARLVASVDGEVTMIAAEVGKTITAYKQVMTIALPGPLDVSADLSNEQLQRLSVGQPALVTFSNYANREFRGVLRRLPFPYGGAGSAQDEDRSTRVTVDNLDVAVERGALARVRVIIKQDDNALWLPPAAIRKFQGRDFVVVQDTDGQRRVSVTAGIVAAERVEILDGLSEGQIVVGP
jgi:multidrug efflux pump subunit AcrA (membrane-fusion protein)